MANKIVNTGDMPLACLWGMTTFYGCRERVAREEAPLRKLLPQEKILLPLGLSGRPGEKPIAGSGRSERGVETILS